MVDILNISKNVLRRLSQMGYAMNENCNAHEKLIFPSKHNKNQEQFQRISEQELRFLFVEEFKIAHPDLFYSVETPTLGKFRFGKDNDNHTVGDGRSASHDMSIYKRESGKYQRIINVEFKNNNSVEKNSGKDILKLIHEEQNGAFIQLLTNTDSGTLNSIFIKLKNSFEKFNFHWKEQKSIELVIISIGKKDNALIYCEINKDANFENIFKIEQGKGNINDFEGTELWKNWSFIDEKPSVPVETDCICLTQN